MVPVLLCLGMVLVAGLVYNLAHLDTSGEPFPPPPGPSSPAANFWGVLLSNVIVSVVAGVALALLLVVLVYALATRKRRQLTFVGRPMRWWETIGAVITFLMLALLLYLWPRIARDAANATASQSTPGNATLNETTIPAIAGIPLGVFLVLALILSIVVIAVLMDLNVRLRHLRPPTPLLARRRAAAAAVDATISELQLGGDVRAAILACYQRFCLLLGTRGIGDQDSLTPRELEGLAVHQLAVGAGSADSLTSLFEEARYSTHALGDGDRERAVESLARIREALGG